MMPPKIQLALDTLDGIEALELARKCAPSIDILEAGTPLIKSEGIGIVRQLRAVFPEKLILADLKSSDVGAYEAEMAFKAGADIVTTQGITTRSTILGVQKEADKWGKRAEVDMTGVADPAALAIDLKKQGVSLVLIHRSIDEELNAGALWDVKARNIVKTLVDSGLDVAIAGGLNADVLPLLKDIHIYAIVVGRGITAQSDPAKAARELRKLVDTLWI
jgi:3-hexulose-6-phosphate synthase